MEIWKDIEGYAGLYQVSSKGRIKSLNYNHTGKERILKPRKDRYGYLGVTIYKDGQRRTYSIHRLVANTFIPNPSNLPQINHIDENKENNCVNNLEWCTSKENINYGTRNERTSKALSKPVMGISLDGKSYLYFNSTMDAERLAGFDHSNIVKCCNGKLKTYKGYTWSFVEGGE